MEIKDRMFNRVIDDPDLDPQVEKLVDKKIANKPTIYITEYGYDELQMEEGLIDKLEIGDIVYSEYDRVSYTVISRGDDYIDLLSVSEEEIIRVEYYLNADSWELSDSVIKKTGTKLYKHTVYFGNVTLGLEHALSIVCDRATAFTQFLQIIDQWKYFGATFFNDEDGETSTVLLMTGSETVIYYSEDRGQIYEFSLADDITMSDVVTPI